MIDAGRSSEVKDARYSLWRSVSLTKRHKGRKRPVQLSCHGGSAFLHLEETPHVGAVDGGVDPINESSKAHDQKGSVRSNFQQNERILDPKGTNLNLVCHLILRSTKATCLQTPEKFAELCLAFVFDTVAVPSTAYLIAYSDFDRLRIIIYYYHPAHTIILYLVTLNPPHAQGQSARAPLLQPSYGVKIPAYKPTSVRASMGLEKCKAESQDLLTRAS